MSAASRRTTSTMSVATITLITVLSLYSWTYRVDAKCDLETLAVYEVRFETFWRRKDFPKHYPEWRPPASWSKMLGFSHNDSFEVFRKGELASPALKRFVESADTSFFDLYTQGSNGILDVFSIAPIGTGAGSGKSLMTVDANHTKVSMVSKINPSPDWFVGVDTQELCQGGRWANHLNLEVGPLDAGTDKGLTFTSPNWPSDPPEKIQPITAHFPSHRAGSFNYPERDELPVLARFIITKLKEYSLSNKFDAADHSLTNAVPEENKDFYRYELENNNIVLEDPKIQKIADDIEEAINTNQINKPPHRRRWPYHKRRYGKRRRYPQAKRLKHRYHGRNKFNSSFRTTLRPAVFQVTEPGLFNEIQKTSLRPTQHGGRNVNRSRVVVTGNPDRKRIPSGDAMAVISDIVKDYQKEHRRKIKKRRREERRRRREQMKKIKPPRDCRVSEWMEWSSCSKTCGIGEQTRVRKIVKHARRGGKPCPLLQETTWCGSASYCERDYFKW